MRLGYVRVSTTEQNPDRQVAALVEQGVAEENIWKEEESGKTTTNRPVLQALGRFARRGDRVIVLSLDRLARSVVDLRAQVDHFIEKGAEVQILEPALLFKPGNRDPMANMMMTILGAFAEFELDLIHQRQAEGIAQARRAGKYKGRQPVSAKKITEAQDLIARGFPISEVALRTGVSRATLYRRGLREPRVRQDQLVES